MRFEDAQRALQQFLAPLTVDEFLDQTLAGGFCKIEGGETSPRIGLLGSDPQGVKARVTAPGNFTMASAVFAAPTPRPPMTSPFW